MVFYDKVGVGVESLNIKLDFRFHVAFGNAYMKLS